MRVWGTVTTMLLGAALPSAAHAAQRLMDVRQVPTDTIRDVALVRFVEGRPIIYYNPALLDRLGPELSAFFFAHEYGHIHHRHSGGALHEGKLGATRQRQELDADCYATEHLAGERPEVVEAALEFFLGMGPNRFDVWHPTGSQRAARILSCLPDRRPNR